MNASRGAPFVFLAIILLASIAVSQQPRRIDDSVLRNAAKSGDEWLTYGLTQAEMRFSPLNQINAGNVSRLGLAWSYDTGSGGGGQEATPLVWNRTIYGITNWSVVFAVDAVTGKERWRWDPEVNQTAVRPKICCGVVNRGLAIYQGMIIAPVIDGRLQAHDVETGRVLWEARVAFPQDGYTVTMAPRIDKGEKLLDIQTGLRSGMGPPITYRVGGKQYVALMGGVGDVPAGSAGPGNSATPFVPKLLTFVLDGNSR